MAWQQYVNADGVGYAQWYDPERSRAWFQRSRDLARVDQRALNARGWLAQRSACLAAWNALANGFALLTVPALWWPGYRDTVADWSPPKREFVAALLRRVGEEAAPVRSSPARIALDSESRVEGRCIEDDPMSGAGCGGECVQAGPTVGTSAFERGCDPYDWNSLTWTVDDGVAFYVPPMRWALELAERIADRALAAGPIGIIQQTRVFTDLHNLREADRLGLSLPNELRDIASRLPADLETARWQSGPMQAWGSAIQAAGATVGAANPALGAAVSTFGTLIASLPNARGADPMRAAVDIAGRSSWWKPTLVSDVDRAPRGSQFDVPWPEGVARPVYLGAGLDLAALAGPVTDPARVLREAGVDCAQWRAMSVSERADALEKQDLAPHAANMARVDEHCFDEYARMDREAAIRNRRQEPVSEPSEGMPAWGIAAGGAALLAAGLYAAKSAGRKGR